MTPPSGGAPEPAFVEFSSGYFRAFLEAMPDATVVVDAKGVIAAINSHAEAMFGYSRDELLGQRIEVLVPESAREAHVLQREGYMASPRHRPMGAGRDLVGRHKSGADIPVEISLNPVDTGGRRLVLAAVRDVTEGREARETQRVAQAQLELKVAERTAELSSANKALRREIDERSRLEREVLTVSEREQQRIGQNLHDDLGQTLTAVTYIAQLLHKKLAAGDKADPGDAVEILKLTSGAIDQVRRLARGLYPVELNTNGLVPALQELAVSVESKYKVSCPVEYNDRDPVRDTVAAIQLYRIAQEAITNALKHAKPGKIKIGLTGKEGSSTLSIEDDGPGFPAATSGKGMGLHIMRYRAGMIGASFDVGPGERGGTRVRCVWRKSG